MNRCIKTFLQSYINPLLVLKRKYQQIEKFINKDLQIKIDLYKYDQMVD